MRASSDGAKTVTPPRAAAASTAEVMLASSTRRANPEWPDDASCFTRVASSCWSAYARVNVRSTVKTGARSEAMTWSGDESRFWRFCDGEGFSLFPQYPWQEHAMAHDVNHGGLVKKVRLPVCRVHCCARLCQHRWEFRMQARTLMRLLGKERMPEKFFLSCLTYYDRFVFQGRSIEIRHRVWPKKRYLIGWKKICDERRWKEKWKEYEQELNRYVI